MELTFTTTRVDDASTTVGVTGEIDHDTAPSLGSQVAAVLAGGAGDVVIDLRGVTFMDSSGLGALVGVRKRVEGAGGTLTLANLSPNVLRIFALTKMDSVFDIVSDDASAPR
jgi:anti-sigma B factor antagonist